MPIEIADVVLYVLIFFGVYYISETPDTTMSHEDQQNVKKKSQQLKQKLHKYRTEGVNMDNMEDIYMELVRRGWNPDDIPIIDKCPSLEEWASRLDLMLQETPYRPRDLNEPGEDRTMAKSTLAVWARPREPDNGDV